MPPSQTESQMHSVVSDSAFDALLAAAEHELACNRKEVRKLRREARERKVRVWRVTIPRIIRRATRIGLFAGGSIALITGVVLLLTGQPGSATAWSVGAAAWGAAAAIRSNR